MKMRHLLCVLLVALAGGALFTATAVVLEDDARDRIAAAKERMAYIDDPAGGLLILDTFGGKVGGSWEDVATCFQDWRREHPERVPARYRLIVGYDLRDSLRVGQ